jgi:cytochrome P450
MELGDIDLTDLDRFTRGFPHETFTFLRREAPVWRHPPTPRAPGGEGFWVISRHAETRRVLADPETFSSKGGPGREGGGTTLVDYQEGEGPGEMLNMIDPPQHTRFRRLVNKGFTARMMNALEGGLRARTTRILDAVAAKGACDFVVDVAAELPLQAIAEILGVPQEDRHQLFRWSNAWTDHTEGDSADRSEEAMEAALQAYGYAAELMEEKRRRPMDDVITQVVHAELEDEAGDLEHLSEHELHLFFILLITAGSETTRNAISHGLLALLSNPAELEALTASPELMKTGVEEILRWTTPTAYNRRTATRDVELGGQAIAAGAKVSFWHASANRDEAVFADPFRLDLRRQPNPHITFGHGPHLCLGAALARIEIRIMYEELLRRFRRIELAGEVTWMRTNKFTGMRHMPIRFEVMT